MCSFKDCGRVVSRLGLCSGHYQQQRIGKGLKPLKPLKRWIPQVFGQLYTFNCGCTHILPDGPEVQTQKVMWSKDRNPYRVNGGCYRCRQCAYRRHRIASRGEGKSGVLGRMKILLQTAADTARRKGIKSPDATPEQLVGMAEDQYLSGGTLVCAASGVVIPLVGIQTNLSHDHKTGFVHGFIHRAANLVEPHIEDFTRDQWIAIYDFWKQVKNGVSTQ